ncbi:MAG: hypothetical protein KatS3mg121_0342 [Gammaproteobacteria bacterium]|nr:MAG: hypothetical protein KatS3mg121_0342 [Gammaproteobacteria bacterium]
MTHRHDETTGRIPALIGMVVRALRQARGLGVNQLGVAAGIEPANLSRFERGVRGGVHAAKYLDLIAHCLDTRASVLYAVAELAQTRPEILDQPERLSRTVTDLTRLMRAYLELPDTARRRIDAILAENRG